MIGLWAKSFEQLNMLTVFFITPLSMVGGVFNTMKMLPAWLRWLAYANPFFYFINGIRDAMIGFDETPQGLGIGLTLSVVGGAGRGGVAALSPRAMGCANRWRGRAAPYRYSAPPRGQAHRNRPISAAISAATAYAGAVMIRKFFAGFPLRRLRWSLRRRLAERANLLGVFGNWSAYTTGTGASMTCYRHVQAPRHATQKGLKRGAIYLMVSDWPARKIKAEPEIVYGYAVQGKGRWRWRSAATASLLLPQRTARKAAPGCSS